MLVSAAVCPHPPLLVPEVAAGAADEVAAVRAASLIAVRRLTASDPDLVMVVGSAPRAGRWGPSAGGSLAGYGVGVQAGGGDLVLPLSLTIGAWLLDRVESAAAGPEHMATRADSLASGRDFVAAGEDSVAAGGDSLAARRYVAVANDAPAAACARLGAELVAGSDRVAVLVMGDGSAKRSTASPGYLDERATGFDAAALGALQRADAEALLALDAELAGDLWVAGRAAWQVLAGAVRATYAEHPAPAITGETLYADAPFGVGYFVVSWSVDA